MAKQKTRAELQSEIDIALGTIRAITKEREDARELANDRKINHLRMMKEIGLMVGARDSFNIREMGDVSFGEIAFRIGQLITAEKEYIELKDRTLPLPKTKVLEDERRDIQSNGGGIGNIGIGRV